MSMILLHIEKLRSSLEASFMKLLVWRERHIKEKTFVIILALAVGILGGIAALVLKWLIHAISGFLTAHM
jgi:CIC family chloride channel protein